MIFFKIRGVLRKLVWRFGRKLYTFARGDGSNDPHTNGEYWLLENVLKGSSGPHLLFDVGANKGDWTARALELILEKQGLRIHAFEPSLATRTALSTRFADRPAVTVQPYALSDTAGEASFYCSEDGAGTNSLSHVSGSSVENVQRLTVDGFLQQFDIASLSMAKIDTEGFDLCVLKGAEKSLRKGRIEIVQFEYNWRWLINHACLRDVFDLIADKPYRLGKLVGRAIEFYEEWHFELDRYFENNYVLVRHDSDLLRLGVNVAFDKSNAITHVG